MIGAFMDLLLDEIHQALELDEAYGTLLARLEQTVQDLVPIELLPTSILLDHHVRDFIDSLIACETACTVQTLAPPADRVAVTTLAGVDDAIFQKSAVWAFHA